MIDTVQLVLLLVIGILTILLVVLGVQVFFILKDFRKTIVKANKVLDNAGSITDNVSVPIASLSTFASSLKAGSLLTAAKFIKHVLSKDSANEEKKHRKE